MREYSQRKMYEGRKFIDGDGESNGIIYLDEHLPLLHFPHMYGQSPSLLQNPPQTEWHVELAQRAQLPAQSVLDLHVLPQTHGWQVPERHIPHSDVHCDDSEQAWPQPAAHFWLMHCPQPVEALHCRLEVQASWHCMPERHFPPLQVEQPKGQSESTTHSAPHSDMHWPPMQVPHAPAQPVESLQLLPHVHFWHVPATQVLQGEAAQSDDLAHLPPHDAVQVLFMQ